MRGRVGWLIDSWRQILLGMLIFGAVLFIFGFRLNSLVPGLSADEVAFVHSADSGRDIMNDPTFAPQKVATYGLIKLGLTSPGMLRLPSVLLAFSAVISLFFILRKWYTKRIALLGSLLLLSSSWLLSIGRLALSDASYLVLLPILWLGYHFYTTHRSNSALLILCTVAALSFYIPGAIWFITLIAVWQAPGITKILKRVKTGTILAGAFGVAIILGPLVWSMVSDSSIILPSLGLPANLEAVKNMPINLLNVIKQLVLVAPQDPQHTLGRLPLLDVFTIAMLVIGMYSLRFQLKLARAQLQILALAGLGLLVAGGGVNIAVLLPLIYVLAASGMAFLLQQWLVVFPRNPLARSVGSILLTSCVFLVSFYHLSRYFIAWPQTPATKNVFHRTLVQ